MAITSNCQIILAHAIRPLYRETLRQHCFCSLHNISIQSPSAGHVDYLAKCKTMQQLLLY